ncbi:dTDP-4-dehydrorhamnose 3,5-epimerase [Candidatus Sumerlaeota bacterium]|nr:dTDP-4-dehydrorhamnose 3,5-epimerase [Candidatus Sumerlaeota bacterium]
MQIENTSLEGLLVLTPRTFEDDRGFFFESYNEDRFRQAGIDRHWAQDNHARSIKNTVRGLHFQRCKGQAKLVRCILGRVWDVAVDIRPDSPTLGKWVGVELTPENKKMLYIPEGFAHGYAVLSDAAETLYKCTTVYDPALEDEVRWDDPEIGVKWPVDSPVLSRRDVEARTFRDYLESVR